MTLKYVYMRTKIYRTVRRSIETYACEILVLSKSEDDILSRWGKTAKNAYEG